MTDTLPPGYVVRSPRPEDAQAVTDVIIACDIEDLGEPDYAIEDLLEDWKSKDFNLETDAWVVNNPKGEIVGYTCASNFSKVDISTPGFTHPEFRGKGIGTYLLRLAEQRAREKVADAPENAQVIMSSFVSGNNRFAKELLEQNGLREARRFWRMQIDMQEAPTSPQLPEGVEIRNFVKGQDDLTVFEAHQESFSDHWGFVPHSFEEWSAHRLERYDFDPSLWFVATEGDEIVGYSLCSVMEEYGWVATLGMRRAWRGKGIAKALLLHSFGEFYRRGNKSVRLGVDSQSLTGATRLYQGAGMYVSTEGIKYTKELRAGQDLRVQSLD